MRIFLSIILFLSLNILCFGQTKTLEIPKDSINLDSYYKHQDNIKKIGLSDLRESTDSLHFRFSTDKQVVDIWTFDFITFKGLLTNFTTGSDTNELEKEKSIYSKYYYNSISLDSATAKHIYNLFKQLSIFDIPSYLSFNVCSHLMGQLTGKTISIENSSKSYYSYREYVNNGYSLAKFKEAKLIDSIDTYLSNIMQFDKSYENFVSTLPLGCYRCGNYYVRCKKYVDATIKDIGVPIYPDGNTTFWYNYQKNQINKVRLPDLATSTDSLHFRFSNQFQSVDIWTNDYITFYGKLSNSEAGKTSQHYNSKTFTTTFVYDYSSIKKPVAKSIYDTFKSFKIFDIPTEYCIKGWESYCNHCNIYSIEYSTPTKYLYKEYYGVEFLKNKIQEATLIDSITNYLDLILDMKKEIADYRENLYKWLNRREKFVDKDINKQPNFDFRQGMLYKKNEE